MNAMVKQFNEIDPFEWLGREMSLKSISYETEIHSTSSEKPIGWQEKAGVFAKMDDELQKDLTYVLATGSHTDNTAAKKRIIVFLTSSIFAVADQEKKRNKDKLPEICQMIAQMELHFFLYPFLEKKYTVEGRLWTVGLDKILSVENYRNNWKHFGDATRMMLEEAKESAEGYIEKYRRDLE